MRYLLPLACLALSGCVAKAAWDVATLPVKAGSQAVDWATTSQSEADRNAGRKARHQREAEAKAARKAERERQREGTPSPY